MLQKLAFTSFAVAGFLVATGATGMAQDAHAKKAPGGYAEINADGSVQAQHNVTNVTHTSTGVYYLTMNKKVDKCAATASIGGDTQTLEPGYVVIAKQGDIVNVNTFATLTLLPADYKFDLIVDCAK